MGNGLFASNPNSAKILSQEYLYGSWYNNIGYEYSSSPNLYTGQYPMLCISGLGISICWPSNLHDINYGGPGKR